MNILTHRTKQGSIPKKETPGKSAKKRTHHNDETAPTNRRRRKMEPSRTGRTVRTENQMKATGKRNKQTLNQVCVCRDEMHVLK